MNVNSIKIAALVAAGLLMGGCHDDEDNGGDNVIVAPAPDPAPVTMSYKLTVANLTNGQPMSPVAAVLHNGDFEGWTLGQSATSSLELLAEAGDNSEFVNQPMVISSQTGTGVVLPGAVTELDLVVEETPTLTLSVATMLVNTNDAFTGIDGLSLSSMMVGDRISHNAFAYDAGTESNSEASGTIPGPADNGEGHHVDRDDVDFVAHHPGVISLDDGLGASVLTEGHRFAGPVISLTIERIN